MLKIRLWAALWAATTIVLALLLFITPAADLTLPVLLAIAALCLAIIAPFDATKRPARLRVTAACGAYAGIAAAALGWSIWLGQPIGIVALLALMVAFGLFLFGWAWTTRTRTHRTGWGGYYDRAE
jgi:hypothetical protein